MISIAGLLVLGNVAGMTVDPAIGGTATLGTALRVKSESLDIVCEEQNSAPLCHFEAKYDIDNPTDHRESAVIAFIGAQASHIALRATDGGTPRTLTDAERSTLVDAHHQTEVDSSGIELSLEAGAKTRLIVTGDLTPGRIRDGSYSRDATVTRHMLLGDETSRPNTYVLDYLISPLRSWAGTPNVSVWISIPQTWEGAKTTLRNSSAQRETVDQGMSFNVDSASAESLSVSMTLPEPRFANGGVFVGAGLAVVLGLEARARLGYEFETSGFLMWALAAETDFTKELSLIPSVELVSPGVITIVPSFGLGLGIPIRLAPAPQVAARAQVSLHWPWFGVVFAVDVFPPPPVQVQFTIFAQIGL